MPLDPACNDFHTIDWNFFQDAYHGASSVREVRRRFFDRGDNVKVAGAAAQVSRNGFLDLLLRGTFDSP
jgi:hypothetical protein